MNRQESHACPSAARGSLSFEALQAARTGKVEKVKCFLEKGGDVNSGDLAGKTMLIGACEHGRIEVVRELLKHPNLHLNTYNMNMTALTIASLYGHDECVKALLESSLQCQVNLDVKCELQNRKQVTALSSAALNRHWSVFKILLKVTEIINPVVGPDILTNAMADDQWDIIQEIFQKDINYNYQGCVYGTVLREAYMRQLWDIIEVVFHKAIIHENHFVLSILDEMLRKKDWKKLESLLKVLSETVKLDINLTEALHGKQNQKVEKMLKEGNYDTDTISGALLVASIVGTSENVVEILVDKSHNYSDETLKFTLIISAIYNRLEIIPLLLQMATFSFKTLGFARYMCDLNDSKDSEKLLNLSFNNKAHGLFPNITNTSQFDIEKSVLRDCDDDDDDDDDDKDDDDDDGDDDVEDKN